MALNVITWFWGDKYDASDIRKLHRGFKRHLRQEFRFIVVSTGTFVLGNEIEFRLLPDRPLTQIRGCFARLRMFDPMFQAWAGLTGRIVCTDLDSVITGPLDPLFDRPEPFLILQGANASNPCPYTAALMMLRAGAYPQVWSDFTVEKA